MYKRMLDKQSQPTMDPFMEQYDWFIKKTTKVVVFVCEHLE